MADLEIDPSQVHSIEVDPSKVSAAPVNTGPVVKPGASDEDIIRSFGYDPKIILSSPRYQEAVKSHGSGLAFHLTDPNRSDVVAKIADSKAGDVGQGGLDVMKGIVQLARHGAGKFGLLSDADVQYGDLIDRLQNQDYLQNIRHGQASPTLRLIGNALFPVPGGAEAKAGERLLVTTGKAAVRGAEAASVLPVDNPQDGFFQQKLQQAGTGAVVGAGTAALLGGGSQAVSKLRSKIVNARTVKLPEQVAADAEAANAGARSSADTANTAAQQQADAAKLSAQQQADAMVKRVETRASDAQSQAEIGAQSTAANLRSAVGSTQRKIDDLVDAAESGDRHAAQVLEQVNQAGDDPARVMESGIALQNWRTAQVAGQKYDDVARIAMERKLGSVPLQGTGHTLDVADAQSQIGLRDRGLERTLSDIRDAVSGQGGGAGVDYGATRKVISQLDGIIRSGRSGDNALISDRGLAQLQQIKNAMEGDVQRFVNKSGVPELQTAQDAADQFYRSARVPFRDVNIAKAGTTDEPDTIFKKFMMAGRGDRAQKFYDALDSKGRSAVQYQIVADAVNKATDAATGDFSPKAFFNVLDKMKDSHGVFFQGADAQSLQGLKNLMTHAIDTDASIGNVKALADANVKRAAEVGKFNLGGTEDRGAAAVAATKAQGQQAVDDITARVRNLERLPLGPGTAAALGITEASRLAGLPGVSISAGAVTAVLGSLKALTMTAAGKRFMLAASTAKPGTGAMASLINAITQAGARVAAK